MTPNRFIQSLAKVCGEHLLDEKWLLCPSLRVGYQWLEAATLGQDAPSGGLVNVRLKTLKSMAIELAGIEKLHPARCLVSDLAGSMIMDHVLHSLRSDLSDKKGYLFSLQPGLNLSRMTFHAMHNLSMARLDAAKIRAMEFGVPAKGEELALLLENYFASLESAGLVDYAEVLQMAIKLMRSTPDNGRVPGDVLLLVPTDLDTEPLEEELLDAFVRRQKKLLPVDEPISVKSDERPGEPATDDLGLLRWLFSPAAAPKPFSDGTASVFRAVGEVNEVREVLRRCFAVRLPLDRVELLHTDHAVYAPLVHEIMTRVFRDGDDSETGECEGPAGELPVTFAEGIPVILTRPGRALAAWLSWILDDCPQKALFRMIREGLLHVADSGQDEGSFPFNKLAKRFASLPIGFGLSRYSGKINEKTASLERALEKGKGSCRLLRGDEETGRHPGAGGRQAELDDFNLLSRFVDRLLRTTPEGSDPAREIVDKAEGFIEHIARKKDELDNLAAHHLLRALREMRRLLDGRGDHLTRPVWDWLGSLPSELTVGGSGPRPGKLHVAHVASGGRTGRPHTFIVGLDERRFPGASLQDPVLLDSERSSLSKRHGSELPPAGRSLAGKMNAFARLLSRLRGAVTLSFSCRSLEDDCETFPSPVVLSAYRILSGEHEGDQESFSGWVGVPASFAPSMEAACLDSSEWWLYRLCASLPVKDPVSAVGSHFPHLDAGLRALHDRLSDRVTEHDGLVVPVGNSDDTLDPASPAGPVLSAHSLETIARCPLRYFYMKVLEIEPPEELDLDQNRWLDALAFGSLLHELFQRFMDEAVRKKLFPLSIERDAPLLDEILQRLVDAYKELFPVPNESAFKRQMIRLKKAAAIFLRSEQEYCTVFEPVYLEVSVCVKPGEMPTAIDTREPVALALPGGKRIRARGRIDRVDRARGSEPGRFSVLDYKTGRADRFKKAELFEKGRVIQHALYMGMADALLKKKVSQDSVVEKAGYFFPGEHGKGDRVGWTASELSGWKNVIERLCAVAAGGCFPATVEVEQCYYCDYAQVCGNIQDVVRASGTKLDNETNTLLDPYREHLRHGQE